MARPAQTPTARPEFGHLPFFLPGAFAAVHSAQSPPLSGRCSRFLTLNRRQSHQDHGLCDPKEAFGPRPSRGPPLAQPTSKETKMHTFEKRRSVSPKNSIITGQPKLKNNMEKSRFRRDNPRCSHFLSPNSKFIVYISFDIFDDLTHDLLCFEFFKIWRYFRESNSLSCQTSSEPSAFRESPLSPSQVANYLRDELKRLRKRRQLAEMPSTSRSPPASPGSPEPMMADLDRASPNSLAGPSSPKSVHVMTKTPTKNGDRPVFTLKQMTMICEKMCKVNFAIHLKNDNFVWH